jgi:hypothetical protein
MGNAAASTKADTSRLPGQRLVVGTRRRSPPHLWGGHQDRQCRRAVEAGAEGNRGCLGACSAHHAPRTAVGCGPRKERRPREGRAAGPCGLVGGGAGVGGKGTLDKWPQTRSAAHRCRRFEDSRRRAAAAPATGAGWRTARAPWQGRPAGSWRFAPDARQTHAAGRKDRQKGQKVIPLAPLWGQTLDRRRCPSGRVGAVRVRATDAHGRHRGGVRTGRGGGGGCPAGFVKAGARARASPRAAVRGGGPERVRSRKGARLERAGWPVSRATALGLHHQKVASGLGPWPPTALGG